MLKKQTWSTPQLSVYGNVEDITEQSSVTKSNPGSSDTVTFTLNGVTQPLNVPGGAGGGSIVNIRRN
jgi:hypothetical protein